MPKSGKESDLLSGKTMKIIPIFKGGASIIDVKPVISNDSKWLLCGSGTKVRVYSVVSGEIVHDLGGHSGVVTCIILHPENQLQAISSALDSCIIRWDYTDGVKLQKYSLEVSLYCLLPWKPESSSYFGIHETVGQNKDHGEAYAISQFDLPRQKNEDKKIHGTTVMKDVSKEVNGISMGGSGDYVACVVANRLHVICWNKKKRIRVVCHSIKPQSLTCVACHPTEHCIATGTSDGNIILWYHFLDEDKPIKTHIHWHSLPVLCLTFSTEGSYLLSGGHECVLVRWQMSSLRKDFLPRLGSPIKQIVSSRDATITAIGHVDNGIQLISNNSNKVLQVYQGLTRTRVNNQTDCLMPAGMVIDPRTWSLVMNGKPGHAQFYSLHKDTQLYNLDIVGQNYISPENLSNPPVLTEVEKIAFSDNGMWLATVERRDDKETTPEIRLKFWIYLQKSQSYNLNTTVESPHSSKVETLKFRENSKNGSVMAVTTCKDGKFKLWSLIDDTDIYRSNQCWNCESVGFYKELPAGPADFSEDGSLLAVGFASTLTLWDPDTNALRTHLSHLASSTPLRHVLFGHGSSSHMLLSTNRTTIIAWNLLSCSVHWCLQFPTHVLVADPRSEHFAAFTANGKLKVFTASSAVSIFEDTFKDHQIQDAIFIPHKIVEETNIKWQKKSQLYFMNKQQKLLTLGFREDEEDERSSSVKLHQDLPETAFSRLLAEKKTTGQVNQSLVKLEGHRGQPGIHFIKELMGTPAHVLPPVTSLCLSFLDTLTLKAKTTKDSDEEEEEDEMDVVQKDESDSDEEGKKENKMDIEITSKKPQIDSKSQKTIDTVDSEIFLWIKNL